LPHIKLTIPNFLNHEQFKLRSKSLIEKHLTARQLQTIHKLAPSLLFLLPSLSFSPAMYSTEFSNQSEIKAFVVNYENQSDLNVFKVVFSNQAVGNEGSWYFVEFSNQSDKSIYFVEFPNQSDLKIFFVKYPNQAGWRNKSKQHLIY